jgi:hypothetical protein
MSHHHHGCGCGHLEKLIYSRRELLGRLGGGIAGLAFADLLSRNGLVTTLEAQFPKNPLAPKVPPLTPRAKAVISVFCYGGVSQIDTWDPKPDLVKWQGETMQGVGEIRTIMGNPGGLMPSPWTFRKHGESGIEVSELFPHMAQHVDDIALIRSMYGISPAHGPALFQMNTGSILAGHPSVGSWVSYGLGSENENLPGFIVFTDHRGGPINGPPNWSNGYLPAAFQGTQLRDGATPIVDLKPPDARTPDQQQRWLRLLHELNEKHADVNPLDTELSARELLEALLEVERGLGRQRHERWGPRTIDLDLLLYGDETIDEPGLSVPHPHLHERRFALEPLGELDPDLVVPGRGRVADLLSKLD